MIYGPKNGMTFFVLGDTHFGYKQNFPGNDLRDDIIHQLNYLPGWPFPEKVGGVVEEPSFVVLCGDFVDGAEGASTRELNYYKYYKRRMRYPVYEVVGNHEAYIHDFFVKGYGSTSYSFEKNGVHFISLNYRDCESGSFFGDDELSFLTNDVKNIGKRSPVVILTHNRLDRIQNGERAVDILSDYRILLIASAHTHIPDVFKFQGISCISVGHCRNHPIDREYARLFYVVRIQADRIHAVPWRWDMKKWEEHEYYSGYSGKSIGLCLSEKI